jgi:peptidoglycan/LPS O-acetylase OafA/YrhL
VLTVVSLVGPLTHMQRQNLWLEYTYLTNFAPLWPGQIVMVWGWSLALEEQFYLAVPALFMLLYRLKGDGERIGVLLTLAGTSLALRLFIYLWYGPWPYLLYRGAVYFRTSTRIDTLVIGILLAYVHQRWGKELDVWMRRPLHRGLIGVGVLACLWPLMDPAMFGAQYYTFMHVFLWGTVTGAMYFGMVLLLLHGPGGTVSRFLSWPGFRKLATLGYGVYLVHIPVCERLVVPLADVLRARGVPLGGVWTASLTSLMLASLAVAYVLHLLVEKPSLWLRNRVAS